MSVDDRRGQIAMAADTSSREQYRTPVTKRD
jgi:hypothetical protein